MQCFPDLRPVPWADLAAGDLVFVRSDRGPAGWCLAVGPGETDAHYDLVLLSDDRIRLETIDTGRVREPYRAGTQWRWRYDFGMLESDDQALMAGRLALTPDGALLLVLRSADEELYAFSLASPGIRPLADIRVDMVIPAWTIEARDAEAELWRPLLKP